MRRKTYVVQGIRPSSGQDLPVLSNGRRRVRDPESITGRLAAVQTYHPLGSGLIPGDALVIHFRFLVSNVK